MQTMWLFATKRLFVFRGIIKQKDDEDEDEDLDEDDGKLKKKVDEILLEICKNAVDDTSVSYTHLDVYKRQIPENLFLNCPVYTAEENHFVTLFLVSIVSGFLICIRR